jgi:hypothetical protein
LVLLVLTRLEGGSFECEGVGAEGEGTGAVVGWEEISERLRFGFGVGPRGLEAEAVRG